VEPTRKRDRSGREESQGRSTDPRCGALDALVGFQRANLLAALGHPRSIGELEEILDTAAGGATYHVRRLEAAGLVMRRRRGQRVHVELTSRGRSLLALYSATP
jgi:DNA-binding MarR family transcriptional regulator